MRYMLYFVIVMTAMSCKDTKPADNAPIIDASQTEVDNLQVDNSSDLSAISTKTFREFKVLDSKYINIDELWKPFNEELDSFSEEDYSALERLILEQNIPTLQNHIREGRLSYEALTKFYLYRIRQFDRENELSLNAVIALNANVIIEAKQKDRDFNNNKTLHPIFGMPILLKDNINAKSMPTTAGALALKNNTTGDAFIVNQLKSKGALILGKANLSEWAYFFCGDCPSGYSAIGGQTLNPYGRKTIDTGGSSSGSGVAVAANFCVAAIGSETAGSILSPASQNSVVGLKPTVGLVSRSGIIPISSTLDTAGPITKNVTDNAIVLDAIYGKDVNDAKAINNELKRPYFKALHDAGFNGERFGVFESLLENKLYSDAVAILKQKGATIIEIKALDIELPEFIRLLNLDMKADLVSYFETYGNVEAKYKSIEDIIAFNKRDSLNAMPYGQQLFYGISKDSSSNSEFLTLKKTLKANGKRFFDQPMNTHNLDAILSINNYHAAEAAVAEYPAITVPMGYTETGEPEGLTFVGMRLNEKQLLEWAYVYEQASKMRNMPKNYN
ncbi:MAG: amidase family protein [Psychroserpens sp.]|uniref:amidase family protein n=1 Tax=Psychroserpens sp. TaxID=2020870 RepID=UPI003C9FBEF4